MARSTPPGWRAPRPALPARGGPLVGDQRRLGFGPGDDWEPSVAAHGRHVYVAISHFPFEGTLQKRRIMLQASHDGGTTWSAPRIVADKPGGIPFTDQAGPVVAVDLDGTVYVSLDRVGLPGR